MFLYLLSSQRIFPFADEHFRCDHDIFLLGHYTILVDVHISHLLSSQVFNYIYIILFLFLVRCDPNF
jgi:hypothetical protein